MTNNKHLASSNYRFDQITLLIVLFNIIALFYIFNISHYSRLLGDDLGINSDVKKFSSIQYVSYVYNTWTGRFSGVFVQYYFFMFYNFFNSILPNVFFLYMIGLFSIFKFLKLFLFDFHKYQVVNFSLLIINILILSSLEIYTIFWVTTHVYYFNVFILFLLFSLIFKSNNSKIEICFIVLLSFYIGGIGEHISPIYILFIFFLLFFFKRFEKKVIFNFILSLIFCFIAFFILLNAPGNLIRIDNSVLFSLNSFFPNLIFVILKMLIFVSFKSIYFLVLYYIFYFVGVCSKKYDFQEFNSWFLLTNFKFRNRLFIFCFFLFFFILVQLPAVLLISNSLPRWSSIHLNFMIILFIMYFSFNHGYWDLKNNRFYYLSAKTLLVLLIYTVSFFYIKEQKIVKLFSQQYDNNSIFMIENYCYTKYNSIFYEILNFSLGEDNFRSLLTFANESIFVPNSLNVDDKSKYFDFFLYRSPFYCR